jgi:hypothetical protein
LLAGNTLPAVIFEMRTGLWTLSLVKPRQSAEVILKTYELFIYKDMYYINTSIRKNVLNIATP